MTHLTDQQLRDALEELQRSSVVAWQRFQNDQNELNRLVLDEVYRQFGAALKESRRRLRLHQCSPEVPDTPN